MEDCLTVFAPKTAAWFRETLGAPTPVQELSWGAIAAGGHVLVSAPTGTGKTLSAFLVFLDRFKKQAIEGSLKQELQLIYISPLKSLAADIRENLKRPLAGIDGEELVTVGVRTGDTEQSERRRMVRKPPHILITTPESLYLMLTGKSGRNMLCTARAVIVDELHALIDTKRGAHLMLSLARLDALCEKKLQRIGLSATIAPLETAAEYLAPEPVFVAAPVMQKDVRLEVLGPYMDADKKRTDSVWKELSELVYQYCQGQRSVLAFVEGRRYAEKLAYYVNLIGGGDFACVHHGSLSKEQRAETEQALRDGKLRLLCATSSMELGIDVGEIDRVLQVGCPRTVSGAMQRLGRAGHRPDRTSVMYLFPRTAAECVLCGMTAKLANERSVERMNPPEGCLDVLAQHLVSMAAAGSYTVEEVMALLPRAWSFRNVTKEEVCGVLAMLAGDYEHKRDIPVRPRLLYDRIHETVEGDAYSRMLAVSAGGTIPDKGLYTVRTEDGVKIGEADEEFVYETQLGDRFLLGSFAWRVVSVSRDTVTVRQAPAEGARVPFWHGEIKGRDKETGIAFGKILHDLQEAEEDHRLREALLSLGLDESAAAFSEGYLQRQIAATGCLPSDKTVIVERFYDRSGKAQLMVHSVFGRRVNAPLALLAAKEAEREINESVGNVEDEDGFLLYSYGEKPLPDGLLYRILPEQVKEMLSALLLSTSVFNMAFRYNCGRALMMGVRGKSRQPLWMQRLRSAELFQAVVREQQHPLIVETRRECMEQLWDVEGVIGLLHQIRSGEILVREIETKSASPMSLPLQWAEEANVMYDYAPTPRSIHEAVKEELQEVLKRQEELLRPDGEELAAVQEKGKLPQDKKQLHSLLMTEGDLTAGELDVSVAWFEELEQEGCVCYLEQGLWIAAEQAETYREAFAEAADAGQARESAFQIVRRMLRYRGASSAGQVAARYGLSGAEAETILSGLCDRGEVVLHDGCYYHAVLYQRARTKTIRNRREEIATVEPAAYAALLTSRMRRQAPPEECVRAAVSLFAGTALPAAMWEELILPARVKGYREAYLDALLAEGAYVWRMEDNGRILFEQSERIVWDGETDIPWETLTEQERMLAEALDKRGASFAQTLSGVLGGEPVYDVLLSLVEKGIVCADSFVPVRHALNRVHMQKANARRRVGAHGKLMQAGRFDLVRETKPLTVKEQIERCFDRYLILCRETAAAFGFSFSEALCVLRVSEYTGEVRRGYFVRGLSGAQFIRAKDFAGVTALLSHPAAETVWVNAADPMQPWGKLLPHEEGRAFLNVSGCAAALRGGRPAAVFEKQGKLLRVFDAEGLEEVLFLFVEAFRRGRLFAGRSRIVIKEYPAEAAPALERCGFLREMQDYVLYR
ncbi:MAG: DEAD/DEAH box helicase [Clostridium sp.]|nr:DEAD/DEAH box helicase [Clostridium sp.]